jgi:wobble nucleotide-excising tRNase
LVDVEQRIVQAEESAPPSDTIRAVFNGLMEFMTVQDYFLDENRKLQIRLDKDYDISGQGVRISSAQRKLLSLCYFFAEMVSDVKHPKELKAYTLVFDDPVDSADYVYFFSIATLIEKSESILSKILAYPKLKIGQTIVLTHNSLIFERLAARWAADVYRLQKEGNVSTLSRGQRAINNYREYIIDICKYYRNPVSQKRRMIYVGNLIRRVLEILSSFDTLGRADIQQLLDGMGKPRLALIANHLSHESFTRVLNPIGSSEELRQACRDLLDVIKERHRWQYETIAKDILKDEEGEEAL